MNETCPHCPLAGSDLLCPRWPTNHTRFCEWADPNHPDHVPDAKGVLTRIALARAGTPAPAERPTPPGPAVPLAGDLVAALTHAVGADRAAKWVAKALTGMPNCGCPARAAWLNDQDRKLRRLVGKLARKLSGAITGNEA